MLQEDCQIRGFAERLDLLGLCDNGVCLTEIQVFEEFKVWAQGGAQSVQRKVYTPKHQNLAARVSCHGRRRPPLSLWS